MQNSPESKRKRALNLLTKLVKAAHTAQEQGKHLALEKIIKEANKLSSKLDHKKHNYKPVNGEIVDEAGRENAIVRRDEIEIQASREESTEESLIRNTKQDLRAEHNVLAIIAAKRDMMMD